MKVFDWILHAPQKELATLLYIYSKEISSKRKIDKFLNSEMNDEMKNTVGGINESRSK